jgi:acyl dehydratase
MAESVVTDEMRALIGVEGPESTSEVTSTGCRLFARAVGHTDLIFFDREAARSRGYRDIVAPPGFLGSAVFRPGEKVDMFHQGPRTPYRRILNGGTTFEYFEPLCAGDVVRSRSKITEFQERQGSIGSMLITSRETSYVREDGTLVAKMYGTLINY